MKYFGLYILIYNAFCLSVIKTDWYSEMINMYIPFEGVVNDHRYNFIDYYDLSFYVLGGIICFIKFKKLTLMQIAFFVTCGVYLAFKIGNHYIFNLGMKDFLFWNWFIIISIPLGVWLEKNINYDRFKK